MAEQGPIRKNTFIIDFTLVPRPIRDAEVVQFLEEKIGMTFDDVISLQSRRNLMFVETPNLDIAQGYVDAHDSKHVVFIDGNAYVVRLFMEDGAINVKVRDLPPQFDNELIRKRLMPYGKIIAMKDDVWDIGILKGKKNGTRTVRMVIMKPIPSYVQVATELAFISYANQQHTCKSCAQPIHPNRKCSEAQQSRVNLEKRLEQAQSIVADPPQTTPPLLPPQLPQPPQISQPSLSTQTSLPPQPSQSSITPQPLTSTPPPPPLAISPYAQALMKGSAPINLNQLNESHRDHLKRPIDQNDPKNPQTLLEYAQNLGKSARQDYDPDSMEQ